MEIFKVPSPNFSSRKGRAIIAIVDHKTAGKFPGCLNWLCNPRSQASAHYLVSRAGEIYQMVQDDYTAWQAGIVNKPSWNLYDGTNPNCYTIGIEHEDYAGDGEEGLTELQYQASLWLHSQLITKWGIPVDTEHIIGHYRIDSVNRPNCPGLNFPWNRLFADLKGVVEDMKVGMELPEVKVAIESKSMEKAVILDVDGKDTTYIPAVALRDIGMTVAWDETSKTVIIKK